MAKLSIIVAPDPRLKVKALPVDRVDAAIRRLMDDMLDSMHAANGIGLAAPQVGVAKRVIVVDISAPDAPATPLRMANPEILSASERCVEGEEGCLSLPEHYAPVIRPAEVRVRYLDENGERREIDADGILAKCIQHEIDHLEGTLFVDHISALKRGIILRKLSKLKRLEMAGA